MVSFLRKITRLSLPTRYLAYGFGEIILIVAGILVALGIDSWMEQRKFEQYERLMLAEISASMKANRGIIDREYLPRLAVKESGIGELLGIASADEAPAESAVLSGLSKAAVDFVFLYDSGAFQSLKSAGIERISNDRLRTELITFYDGFLPSFKRFLEMPDETSRLTLRELRRQIAAPRVVADSGAAPAIELALTVDDIRDHPSFLTIIQLEGEKARNQRARLSAIIAQFDRMIHAIDEALAAPSGS